MDIPPFLLDHWLAAYDFRTPPIPYNLASSTGPSWTLEDVMALGAEPLALSDTRSLTRHPKESMRFAQLLPTITALSPTGLWSQPERRKPFQFSSA